MSSPALSMYEAVCVPLSRVPIDTMIFVSYILPHVVGYFMVAVLAVTRRTHTLRVALWPLVASLAWHAAATVDMSLGKPNRNFHNTIFVFLMIHIATRTLDWSRTKAPLTRHLRPAQSLQSTMVDALDLASTLRGYGWDWSHGVYIPRETRPTSRGEFTFYVILSAIVHALIWAVLHRAILSFSPTGLGALSGGSIFDETLPFYLRYLRSSVISALTGFWLYALIQTCYDTCTIVAVLVFGQDPTQWPPAFDAPWRATSLCDFWGRRWHQFFRRLFLIQGGYPLSFFLGRAGLVVGTFLSSAVMHHIGLVMLNDELELWRMLVGFGMMGPVVLAEGAFKQLTGRKVDGWTGWVWTMAWLLLLGNVIVEGLARAGVFGHLNFNQGNVPGQAVIERSVANFDFWLHAL